MPLNMKRNIYSCNMRMVRENAYLYSKDYFIRIEPSYNILNNYDSLNKIYGDEVKNRYNYLNINGKDIS